VGYVVVMGRPMSTSQDFVNWICSDNLNPHFLKYVLLAEREALLMFAVGSVHQTIYFPEAKAFHVCMPDRRAQDSIVEVLGALDDKIELNRRMNETLEAMARAIFKDWFVDFGPTRAKMEGRAPYLAADIWPLFAANLDGEGKPEGWTTSTIGQEVEVVGGSTPSTKEAAFWGGHISWVTPKDLSSLSTPVLLSTERQITEAGLSQIGSGLLPAGTVLLSSRAPIGYMAIAQIPVAVNQGFIAMICKKRLSNVFVWLWTQANMETVHQNANGSTFQEISKANFRPIEVTIAIPEILRAFDETARPLLDRIVANEKENRTLAATRDFLLPRLMSGEVRVRDAEKLVGNAT
jgi:type I restriction enzyme S subunit